MTQVHKKDKIQMTITGILIVVLIFSIFKVIHKSKKRRQTVNSATTNVLSMLHSSEGDGKGLYHHLEDEVRNFEFERDPFFREAHDDSKKLMLNGISWAEQGAIAIINDQVVQVGGVVAGYVIVDIQKDSVIVDDGTGNTQIWVGVEMIEE